MTAGGLSDPSKMPHVIAAKYKHNECCFSLVAVCWKYEITALVLRLNTYWRVVTDQVQLYAAKQKSCVKCNIYIYYIVCAQIYIYKYKNHEEPWDIL